MTERERVIMSLSAAGDNVESRMRSAVDKILDLVWDARSDKFAFADNEDIDAEVNRILAMMSDGMLDDANAAASSLLKALDFDEWEDESLEYAGRDVGGETMLFRFDMQASHLKELLESWIVVASVYGLSKLQTWTNLLTYLSNPLASNLWRGAGLKSTRWGRGYLANIKDAYARLKRDYISRAYHYAKQLEYADGGAIGYTIHRGSGFICPLCDSYTGKVYPIGEMILPIHPNCMCYTKPVFK